MTQLTGIPRDRIQFFTAAALIALFSFLWFYFPARYVLFANHDVTLFLTTPDYLKPFLKRPGGFLEYAGSFIAQFLRFRLAGALLLAGIVTTSFLLVAQWARRNGRIRDSVVAGVVTAALFISMINYYPHRMHHSLGLLLSLFLAGRAPIGGRDMRIFMGIALPLLYVLGGGFVWFFILTWIFRSLFREMKFRREWLIWGVGYPALILLVFSRFIYLQPFRELLLNPLPLGPDYGRVIWPLVFAGWIWFSPLLAWFLTRVGWEGKWRKLTVPLVMLTGSVLVIGLSYNRKNAEFFMIEELAVNEEWEGLLRYADEHPSTNLFGSFYTNLALFYQDRLCRSLFDYPQPFGRRGLCFEWDAKGEVLRRGSDFFWAIGFVNEAHHWAFESMIVDGITRRNLRRLIQTELVSGNLTLAGKYIGLMNRTLFDKGLSRNYARYLDNPGSILQDPHLGARAGIRIRKDFFADGLDLERNLKFLAESEPATKPVLDYLMALYLLERRVDEIVALLPGYLEMTRQPLPVLLDETLLVYKITHREDNRTGISVSEQTSRKFEEYAGILRQTRDQEEAARLLYPKFGHTFWFYLNFSELLNY